MPRHDPDILALVEHFYALARADPQLGPVFAAHVADWPHHHAALATFWTAQLRGRGTYQGIPLAAHRPLALTPAMFPRWLALWDEATGATMPPAEAASLQGRARLLADRLVPALFENVPCKPR